MASSGYAQPRCGTLTPETSPGRSTECGKDYNYSPSGSKHHLRDLSGDTRSADMEARMEIDRPQLQKEILELYDREHFELGESGTFELLERGREWDLSGTLSAGGVVVFPHAGVKDCGHQIAAAVHACLDSGADNVLVISVLHAFTDEMEWARRMVAEGMPPAESRFWGIQGPGAPSARKEWRADHALMSFRHFWKAETKRRGKPAPRVIERYPYLAGGEPHKLKGIEETIKIAENAAIVSTADPFHHGIGYGDDFEEAKFPEAGGLALARTSIEKGIEFLKKMDYAGYNQHCVHARSDARDAGQLFTYLRGPMTGTIRDLTYSEADKLYRAPRPTWVATALIEWQRA